VNEGRWGLLLLLVLVLALYGHGALRAAAQQGPRKSPAERYIEFAIAACDAVEADIPRLTRVGEVMARRSVNGGMIRALSGSHPLTSELTGRAGGMIHMGVRGRWQEGRDDSAANDMVMAGFGQQPETRVLDQLRRRKQRGCYIVGFGPAHALKPEDLALCDEFFDNGVEDEWLADLRGGVLIDVLNAWALTAEHVGALTRLGKMPPMYISTLCEEGPAWAEKYRGRMQFHDDIVVPPVPPGELARRYVAAIRELLVKLRDNELADLRRAAELISAELAQGRKTPVLYIGHMCPHYVGKGKDGVWAEGLFMYWGNPAALDRFREQARPGTLVFRLGYLGLHRDLASLYSETGLRVILATGENTRPEWQPDDEFLQGLAVEIDMGYKMGDAAVTIEGYPIRVFPPSGVLQLVTYEAVNAEVLSRVPAPAP